jgi:uncharacterized protein YggE
MNGKNALRFALAPLAGLIGLLVVVALVVAMRPDRVAAADPERSTVTVFGDGRVIVQPDVATVNIGVEATGQTLEAAQTDAATRMQAVIDTLVGLGISRDDIKTTRLGASPIVDPKNATVIQGYRANNSVQVKLRQLDQVGGVVDAVTAAGANRIEGISFSVEQIEAPKGQARGVAMQNARTKGDQLASLAGLRIVGIKAIEEHDASSTPRPQPYAAPAAASAAPPVEPGTQEVRTQVTVTYFVE